MKILLLNTSDKNWKINKDVMAGFGEGAYFGRGLRLRVLSCVKQHLVSLPLMAFGYLSAIFKNKGHEVVFSSGPLIKSDITIIHSSLPEHKSDLDAASDIRKRGWGKVGFIGPLATFKPEIYESKADFVIQGEPEEIAIKMGEGWIPEGVVQSKKIMNLDTLPYPDWSPFPIREYSYAPAIWSRPFLTVLSSRGCMFGCTYCPYQTYYSPFRLRSPENVIGEIKELINRYRIRGLLFRDPLFTYDRERAIRIADEIRSLKAKLHWACETRIELLDKELIDIFKRSGLRTINIGIESSNHKLLQQLGRQGVNPKLQEETISLCRSRRIKTNAFYILGFPGESIESIKNTIDYAVTLNTTTAEFFAYTPFPGTMLYEKIKNNKLSSNLEDYDSFTPVFDNNGLSREDLARLVDKAFTHYYFRLEYILKHGISLLRDM